MNPLKVFAVVALFASATLMFLCKTASAQDPVKASPTTHKMVLENERVRVIEARIKPGEKAAMHSHPAHVVYVITTSKIKFTYPDGKTEELEPPAGATLWFEPVTHAAENVGTSELRVLAIELKEPPKMEKK